jgi:hypothetical protein
MTHANLDCPKTRQHLTLYAGRDLEEALCAAVERHLEGCEPCRRELASTLAARERFAHLRTETARAAESVDLWPGVRARWASSRAEPVANAPSSAPRPAEHRPAAQRPAAPSRGAPTWARRAWLPTSLAAAAVLVVAFRSGFAPDPAPNSPPISGPGSAPISGIVTHEHGASVAGGEEPAAPVIPGVDGALRRAQPGDERLRDSSAPFDALRPGRLLRDGRAAPNSLASDQDLR